MESKVIDEVDIIHIVTEINGSKYEKGEELKLPPKLEIPSVVARAAQSIILWYSKFS